MDDRFNNPNERWIGLDIWDTETDSCVCYFFWRINEEWRVVFMHNCAFITLIHHLLKTYPTRYVLKFVTVSNVTNGKILTHNQLQHFLQGYNPYELFYQPTNQGE